VQLLAFMIDRSCMVMAFVAFKPDQTPRWLVRKHAASLIMNRTKEASDAGSLLLRYLFLDLGPYSDMTNVPQQWGKYGGHDGAELIPPQGHRNDTLV
jgi:hypothetical protein